MNESEVQLYEDVAEVIAVGKHTESKKKPMISTVKTPIYYFPFYIVYTIL